MHGAKSEPWGLQLWEFNVKLFAKIEIIRYSEKRKVERVFGGLPCYRSSFPRRDRFAFIALICTGCTTLCSLAYGTPYFLAIVFKNHADIRINIEFFYKQY